MDRSGQFCESLSGPRRAFESSNWDALGLQDAIFGGQPPSPVTSAGMRAQSIRPLVRPRPPNLVSLNALKGVKSHRTPTPFFASKSDPVMESRPARRSPYSGAALNRMIQLLILAVHLLTTIAKLARPGGLRVVVVAESLLLKHHWVIRSRARRRAPNLNSFDRFVLGLGSLFVPASRIPKLAIISKPRRLCHVGGACGR